MNRAQRRQSRKAGREAAAPLLTAMARAEAARAAQEAALLDQARSIRATTPAPGETVAEALRALEAGIRDIEAMPTADIVAGPALAELRALREDLARRLAVH